jgi:hypothetical protein
MVKLLQLSGTASASAVPKGTACAGLGYATQLAAAVKLLLQRSAAQDFAAGLDKH